ncbi:fatty acid alpha-hydroxylase [Gnomoniopsis sp. IMI 355080]|nr:fatty acid alpha-hydroxylase [Gnomoniopsis sp. IMI 355080]
MPSRTLPTFTRADVEAHNSAQDCYVTLGGNVYDVSDFVESHPGGPELITDWAGKDIAAILKDEDSHTHSESAYEILEESLVGFVVSDKAANGHANGNGNANGHAVNGVNGDAHTNGDAKANGNDTANGRWVHPRTGMSSAEDLSKETDLENDYKTHKFIDLNKPMFLQVWNGGFSKRFYLEQVHRPRHYKGGASAPFFGNFLEPLTKTPWWIIPSLWWPCITYVLYEAGKGFHNYLAMFGFFMVGIAFWTLFEYLLHRFAFHLDDYLPDNRVGVTLHFTLHGVHHYLPMDKYRLVLPPALFLMLAWPFWYLAHFIFSYDWYVATTVFAGGIFGYTCYDMTHYFLHHQNLPLWYKQLKKYHLEHHFLDYENGFGVTSKFWDVVFGTEIKHTDMKTK